MRQSTAIYRLISSALLLWLTSKGAALAETVNLRIVDGEGSAVPDAVVELVPTGGITQAPTPTEATVDHVEKEFVPLVTVVPRGSQVNFPNSDDILHHVYSFSPTKTFDIPLYGNDQQAMFHETFDQPGVVEIGCNIHDWMLAYIYVAESALARATDADGNARLEAVAPGSYTLRVWHPRLPQGEAIEQPLTVSAGADVSQSIPLSLGRDRRLRRAPSSSHSRYR